MSAKLLGRVAYVAGLSLWVIVSLILGQSLAGLLILVLPDANESVLTTILAALGYILALALALGLPALISRTLVSKRTLGLDRLPSWSDTSLGIVSVLPYYLLSAAILWFGMEILNVINPDIGQQIPFDNLSLKIEYVVAFITLVIMAPFAEELLFRGYFFGRLQERTGKWAAVGVTAVIFGLMHLIGFSENGLVLQWGAAADTFALGLVVGMLRLVSGSIWAGVLLHSLKNAIAYYFLFISPSLPTGM